MSSRTSRRAPSGKTKYPCVFRTAFIREQVDPRVQATWKSHTGKPAPFGDLRRIWQTRHCSEVNPYGSEDCTYKPEDCALAFLQAVEASLAQAQENPVGYFRRVAFSMGQVRADDKPRRDAVFDRSRDHLRGEVHPAGSQVAAGITETGPMMGHGPQGPGDPRATSPGPQAGPEVRSPSRGPISIGDVLRSLDLGPREGRPEDGQEGPQR
jgi:hypothetical protein